MPLGLAAISVSGRRQLKAKVCLVGEIAVGKTSLVRRYTIGSFNERYTTTLGINLSKKVVDLPPSRGDPTTRLELIVFDIMGQRKLRELLTESYFKSAQGLLAVCDVTRRETLEELPNWIEMANGVAGQVPLVIAANKMDLAADSRFDESDLSQIARGYKGEWLTTSARTGANVEEAFRRLAIALVAHHRIRPNDGEALAIAHPDERGNA